MTQEDKEILLKDLCTRLPYNPAVEYKGEVYNVLGIAHGRLVLCKPFMSHTLNESPLVEEVKPYLFPPSSMTKEQMDELEELCDMYIPEDDYNPYSYMGIQVLYKTVYDEGYEFNLRTDVIDWFNRNNLDWGGLIPKGLANDATDKNIY